MVVVCGLMSSLFKFTQHVVILPWLILAAASPTGLALRYSRFDGLLLGVSGLHSVRLVYHLHYVQMSNVHIYSYEYM